jgi:predicted DNA-binding transcriptional regulator
MYRILSRKHQAPLTLKRYGRVSICSLIRWELNSLDLNRKTWVGLTVNDIEMGLLQGSKGAFVDKIKQIDEQVDQSRCPVLLQETFLTYEGIIRIRNILKQPVIGRNGNTIAIFAYDDDLTSRCELFDLFSLYEQHYLPKQAIQHFLEYLKIKSAFREMPTHTEVHVLIAMSSDVRHKRVAKLLKIKPRTVDCHVFSLRGKLKEDISLHGIIGQICNGHRYTYSLKDRLNS